MHRIICNVSTNEVTQVDLTEEEILEIVEKLAVFEVEQTALLQTKYQRLRAAEYPPIADYVDGIVKGDTAQVLAYIDACLAIKAKYPKPQ